MAPARTWRHSFQTLGFAFIIIGALLAIIGFIGLNTLTPCPSNGCGYNPLLGIAASAFPSGITLVLAGLVILWMVGMESQREDRGAS